MKTPLTEPVHLPGEFRHRVDLEQRVLTEGGTGDPQVKWEPVAKDLPAKIVWATTREFVAGGLAPTSVVVATIVIRWRDDVDATMRLKRKTHKATPRAWELYNIAGVLPDRTGRRFLSLPVTLGVNEG